MSDTVDEWGLPIWPAPERNKHVILEKLLPYLPELPPLGDQDAVFLEIGAGTGQHMQHFFAPVAAYVEGLQSRFVYQPTDIDEEHLTTLAQRVEKLNLPGLLAPLKLDAGAPRWPVDSASIIFNANTIHIASFDVCEGLFAGVGRILDRNGVFFLYGPFSFQGQHVSLSNQQFDESLQARNLAWGVRDIDQIMPLAEQAGLVLKEQLSMPANNHLLVFHKKSL